MRPIGLRTPSYVHTPNLIMQNETLRSILARRWLMLDPFHSRAEPEGWQAAPCLNLQKPGESADTTLWAYRIGDNALVRVRTPYDAQPRWFSLGEWPAQMA